MTVVRRNKFSGQKQFKFINMPFETYVVGAFLSYQIKKSHQKVIYKQDTEESQLVQSCLDKLVESNNLNQLLPFKSIKLLHNENAVALFMSLD